MVGLRGDPVYAITKAYALKSFLLPFSALEELSDSATLTDFIERLRASPYSPYLTQLQKPYTALDVEKAFRRGLVEVHYRLMETAPWPDLLKQYFMRYVYFNIKTVLKGKAVGKPVDEIMKSIDLYPETLLGIRDKTLRALSAKDLSETMRELAKTELATAASSAIAVWEKKKDFSAVDAVIDKAYIEGLLMIYRSAPRTIRNSVKTFVAFDVDGYALTTALRSKAWNLTVPQAREFLPSQTIEVGQELLESLLTAEDLKKMLQAFSKTGYFADIVIDDNPAVAAAQIEEALKRKKIRYASQSFYKTPYQQTVLLSFIVLKEAEVQNLSTIAKNIEEGVSDPNVIQRFLISY